MHAIQLRGARTNNLRGIDLDLEPGSLVVVCGPSGAGKSSLAFETLYAEGQRRYVESFSAYARQFLERMARPPLDGLEWMPASIAVDRGGTVKTSRSTVATLTELGDYLKQLWALTAELDCPACGERVRTLSPTTAAEAAVERWPDARVVVSYPLSVLSEEDYLSVRDSLLSSGYRRLWIDGEARDLDTVPPSAAVGGNGRGKASATLQVIADRTSTRTRDRARLTEALEMAFERSGGQARINRAPGEGELDVSRGLRCDGCGATYRKPSPGLFSYNNPVGACDTCRGFGRTIAVDWDKVLPDLDLSLAQGAIRPWNGRSTQAERRILARHCKRHGIPMDVPLGRLTKAQRDSLIEGDGGSWRSGFPGLRRWFEWLETRTYKMHVRVLLARYRKYDPCADCGGSRFKPEVHAWKVNGQTLPELMAEPVSKARQRIETLRDDGHDVARGRVIEETLGRLTTLCDVGLGYLALDRTARSLSGGELQRVGLMSGLGSGLTGTLFVLDEPTVGLHPADVERLLPAVRRIASGDNIALVVESDERFVRAADRVVELGPGAGNAGGELVFDGTPAALSKAATATGSVLRRTRADTRGRSRKRRSVLKLKAARGHNLQRVDLEVPLGLFSCVTGVSGSGKSSLIAQTLVPAVARALKQESPQPLAHGGLTGLRAIERLAVVDQTPLGRTSRGNPATYLGVWDVFRKQLTAQPLAKERGYKPGAFSFNVAGGRCEACKGEGSETVEMQFLADVRLSCPECGGKRFVGPTLDVQLDGLDVAELLELTAHDALERFGHIKGVRTGLEPLVRTGAGYLRLGQPLNTLSGGEAQRLKLAEALRGVDGRSLVVLDEPTAGLHASDVDPLLECLDELCDRGATVLVVEHDMRIAAHADHVIDLGPGAGELGGQVVVTGTPPEVAACESSATAPFLAAELAGPRRVAGAKRRRRSSKRSDHLVQVRGAREHNLKDVDVDIPRNRLVAVTGPSGSGKSTLAFDVVFAESQRRYLETLSPYVRQYLQQLPRPDVDQVRGMPPGVSLEQRQTGGAKNSTVATVTEVAHYLRLAYARAGRLSCPDCEIPIEPRSPGALAGDVKMRFGKSSVSVLAPVIRAQKGSHRDVLERARSQGVTRAWIDGEPCELKAGMKLDRYKEHDIELVLGRTAAGGPELEVLLTRALTMGEGGARVVAGTRELWLSVKRACPGCGQGFPEPDPRFFSFNTRQGACETCEGRGVVERGKRRGKRQPVLQTCGDCNGKRLAGLALHTRLDGDLITGLLGRSVEAAAERLESVELEGRDGEVARVPLAEALLRLRFLERVGLGYLDLDRPAWTLSGGEMQRVRLAAQLGSGLTGVLYVLDEPTIGLHPRDTGRLLGALRDLVDQGNSVLVVEHDADTIRAADHMIDVGPTGGHDGGRILAEGPPARLLGNPDSITGRSLASPLRMPDARRPVNGASFVEVLGARQHNLANVHLRIPVGLLTVVTGVSGSGKSTLVSEVMLRGVRRALGLQSETPGAHDRVRGAGALKRAVEIDQSPIGRTPRSVPATYVGAWDEIRKLYARTPQARARGYDPSRFSFNVAKGRCPDCEGQGTMHVEMSFLPDAHVHCDSCDGMRFDPETLAVQLHGASVGELLTMHVDEVADLLSAFPKVRRPLELMVDLGLGYLKLGQASNTLSGGEAQRLKLVSELAARSSAGTLYVMDEPTTGLHREDVGRLLQVIQRLVDRGETVVVIEHHPDVMAAADWMVDLGPEGGGGGGTIVAEGTPETIMNNGESHTGRALREALDS